MYKTHLLSCSFIAFCTASIALLTHCILTPAITYPDSLGYQNTALEQLSLDNLLSSIRTPVYPFILRLTHSGFGSFEAILPIQCLIFSLSLVYVYSQLIRCNVPAINAIFATLPLFLSQIAVEYGHIYLTETLGTAFAIFTFGATLSFVFLKPKRSDIIVLATFTLLSILTRPAFLFLPIFTLLVVFLFKTPQPYSRWSINSLQQLTTPFLATVTPLLAYCTLRLLVVGHFGIVSFGGTNLAGLALNPAILTSSVADSLKDPQLRGAAKAVLNRRELLRQQGVPGRPEYPSYVFDEKRFNDEPLLPTWSRAYNASCWEVGVPAIATYLNLPETRGTKSWIEVNNLLSKLSKQAIITNPMPYLRWLLTAGLQVPKIAYRYENNLCKLILTYSIVIFFLFTTFSFQSLSIYWTRSPYKITLISTAVLSTILLASNYFNSLTSILFILSGTVSPVLIPVTFMIYGAWIALTRLTTTRDEESRQGIALPTEHLISMGTIFFLGGLFLVILVEEPLDRYLLALLPPFSLGLFLCLYNCTAFLVGRCLAYRTADPLGTTSSRTS